MPTIKQALQNTVAQFSISDTPSLDAQVLLCHVLGVERVYLLAHPEQTLTDEQVIQFAMLVKRHADGEPIAYILGTKEFYDLEFIVTPDVLIPRPETELLVEIALDIAREKPNPIIADIGTGSGAISVTVAHHAKNATVYAIDISPQALKIARQNAAKNQADVIFFEGNLAQPLIDNNIQVDLLLANLPYIADDELPELAVTKYEPSLALAGGDDGLDLIRVLLEQVPQVVKASGTILLEMGWNQGESIKKAADKMLSPLEITIIKDYGELNRIVRIDL